MTDPLCASDIPIPQVADFRRMQFVASAPKPSALLDADRLELAFAGRSNSGKSSALNALCEHKNLARVSKTPGRTQAINFFDSPGLRLADLPGYGFARVPPATRDAWRRLIEIYFSDRPLLAGVVLIMDARRPLQPFDEQLLAWGEQYGLAFHVVLTKADKLGQQQRIETERRVQNAVGDNGVQLFSALKRQGVDSLRDALIAIAKGHRAR